MSPSTPTDAEWMQRALQMAQSGQGRVEPNPMVGCLLVRDGVLLGAGFHARFGGPHAEVEALRDSGDAHGATAYVTLEPCCHQGKTPPCTQALIKAGVTRVVVAMPDPFPSVDGGGVRELQDAGIEVEAGVLEQEARSLNAPYLRRLISKRPWVIAKWAMSLDGKIATRLGHSQWISNAASRAEVHRLRGRVDGIIVGRGTVIADDPLLTARPPGPRRAARIVIDSQARLPLTSKLCQTAKESPVLVACGPAASESALEGLRGAGCRVWVGCSDPDQRVSDLLAWLADQEGMTNVMIEGGPTVLASFWRRQVIDETQVYIASKLIGGREAPGPIAGQGADQLSGSHQFQLVETRIHDGDVQIISRVAPP